MLILSVRLCFFCLSCLLPSLLSKLSVSVHPPVPFYQSPVGTVSQSGQACPLLCPCTG